MALGALLGLFGGVVTAPRHSPGPKWTFLDFGKHFTEPAYGTEIQGTQLVDKVFVKALKTANGSIISLFTGRREDHFHEPGKREEHHREYVGALQGD